MRKIVVAAVVMFFLAGIMPAPTALAAENVGAHRLGLGLTYWKTLDNIDLTDVDENGVSWVGSYQYAPPGLFKFELDAEYYPKDFAGSSQSFWAPEAYVIVGGALYAGAGIGIYYHDGDWADEPFYMLRAGFDFPVLPFLFLDLNANYRFNDWGSISGEMDTDTIRLGAALRIAL